MICPNCGRIKTVFPIKPHPSVTWSRADAATFSVQQEPQTVEACERCDKLKFKESYPDLHRWLNRERLTPEERAYYFGPEA